MLFMRSSLGVDWSVRKVQSAGGIEVHLSGLQLRIDRPAGGLAAQVAAELRSAIRSGRLAAGARLPASRELAHDLGTSRGVVVEAYEQLVAEGFLVARQGSGT